MILIIYAHPDTNGHCKTILDSVKNELEGQNKEYKLVDLYQLKYDPILHENEHYTAGGSEISEENLGFQEEIKKADNLIFIYPIWWGTMPAILKGFFDRVLTPGFAFKYIGGLPIGLLKNKRAIIFSSSGGSNLIYKFWLNPIGFIFGERQKMAIQKDILYFCGIKSKFYQIYNARKLSNKKVEKIKKVVKNGLKFLD